ncbi:MAG: radical SAM protein, partial [Myxococcales bacterium]|nr:radical SAM protein [Myxococcales bacterium]
MSKHTFANKLRAVGAVISNRVNDDPLNITLELTRRCNARCDYCNHWQEQKQTEQDLADYVAVVRRFRPFSVTICGGEPFMRKDALEIIRAVRSE